ncbi:MAG: N-glycosylase/DNA lyase [Candidatus Thorarchaeota archaeon]
MFNSLENMEDLFNDINDLKKSEIKKLVDNRINEFDKVKSKTHNKLFEELCFCIMTANCSADKCIEVQELIGDGFLHLSEEKLAHALKLYGYRFPNIRAKYIAQARQFSDELKSNIKTHKDPHKLREWIVNNIKGLGYKEASHFLRNIGFTDYAIIDFHILDLLERFGLIKKPRSLTKSKYLEIEESLRKIAETLNLNLAELDLYMWYMETGKILK